MKRLYFLFAIICALAMTQTVWAEDITINVNTSTGSFTATNSSGTYAKTWTDNTYGLTFGTTANNMFVTNCSSTQMAIYSGNNGCTYTITSPTGYTYDDHYTISYTFTAISEESSHTITPSAGTVTYQGASDTEATSVDAGTAITIPTDNSVTITVSDVAANTAAFALSNPNDQVTVTDFVITLKYVMSSDYIEELRTEYLATIAEWEAVAVTDGTLFYPNSTLVAALKTSVTDATATEATTTAYEALADQWASEVTPAAVMNMPTAGATYTCQLQNKYYPGYYMAEDANNYLRASTNYSYSNSVWTVAFDDTDASTATLQNYYTNYYVQGTSQSSQTYSGSASKSWTVWTRANCSSIPFGYIAFGGATASTSNNDGLHSNSSKNIVGWNVLSDATHWAIEPLTDDALNTIVTASTNLLSGSGSLSFSADNVYTVQSYIGVVNSNTNTYVSSVDAGSATGFTNSTDGCSTWWGIQPKEETTSDKTGYLYLGSRSYLPVNIYSFGQAAYINAVSTTSYSSTADDATTWYVFSSSSYPASGQPDGSCYFISSSTSQSASSAWNDTGSTGTSLTNWAAVDGTNAGSAFYIAEIDLLTSYDTDVTAYQTTVNGWTTADTTPFYANTTAVADIQSLVTTATNANPTTDAAAATQLAILEQNVVLADVINHPATNTYYYFTNKNTYSDAMANARMAAAREHLIGSNYDNNVASRNIWVLESATDADQYYIKNYLTGEYVQSVSSGTQVAMSTSPVAFTIDCLETGYGAFKYAAGDDNSYLHLETTGNVVGWSFTSITDNAASEWTLTEVADPTATTVTEAETTLTNADTYVIAAINASTLLLGTANTYSTLNDYIDYTRVSSGYVFTDIYNQLGNEYYRFTAATGTTYAGNAMKIATSDEGTTAMTHDTATGSTGTTTDVNELWQLIPTDDYDGFYVVNANLNAAGENCASAQPSARNTNTSLVALANASIFRVQGTGKNDTSGDPEWVQFGCNAYLLNFGNSSDTNIMDYYWSNDTHMAVEIITNVDITLNNASDGYYASTYLPFDVSAVTNATPYYLTTQTDNESALTMNAITSIPAGTGVILYDASNSSATLTIGTASATVSDNELTGTTVKLTSLGTIYSLGSKSNVAGMRVHNGTTLAANRAYMTSTTASNFFSFVNGDGDLTAVSDIDAQEEAANAVIYDLQGRRVASPQKGNIYIINGRTVRY